MFFLSDLDALFEKLSNDVLKGLDFNAAHQAIFGSTVVGGSPKVTCDLYEHQLQVIMMMIIDDMHITYTAKMMSSMINHIPSQLFLTHTTTHTPTSFDTHI